MWAAFRFAWSLLGPRERYWFLALTAAQMVANGFDLLGIAAVGLLVMAVASGSIDVDLAGVFRIQIDESSPALIAGLVLAAALSFMLKAVFNLLLSLGLIRYLARIEVSAALRAANYLLSGSLSSLRRYSISDISYTVNPSTNALLTGVLTSISSLIAGFGLLASILGAFFIVNHVAALVISGYLILVVGLIQWVIGSRLKQIGIDVRRGSIAASAAILDSVRSFREIAVLGKQEFFLQKYSEARWLLADTTARSSILRSVPRLVIEQGLMLGVLGFVGWQILGGDTASGLASVSVFVVGGVRIIGAVMPIQNAFSNLKTTVVKAEMAKKLQKEILDTHARASFEEDSDTSTSHPVSTHFSGGIGAVVSDVDFTYPGATEPAVTEISLEVSPGGFIALVGPSGAGKTTIADLILGLNAPSQGRVLVGGTSPVQLRKEQPGVVSYVPQKPGMVTGTIAQNIALGVNDDLIDEEWVWECIRLAALDEVVRAMPSGIHSSLGKQSDALSGGQLQRLGLARALYTKPKLIILDEATSALDAGSEAAVSKNIRELGESVTLIVIAHRLSTIQHADCVYVVDEGKIIATGPFNTLRKTVPMIEEYVRLMSFDDTEG